MNVELQRTTLEDRVVLENLLSLYGHDFSEIVGDTPGEDGRFAYPRLGQFLRAADRNLFLIRADGAVAGLVFVSAGSVLVKDPDVWDMTEFFVVRGLRRQGVGQAAAQEAFRSFPGRWEVRVMARNESALKFWRDTIRQHTGYKFSLEQRNTDSGSAWHVFRFSQPAVTPLLMG